MVKPRTKTQTALQMMDLLHLISIKVIAHKDKGLQHKTHVPVQTTAALIDTCFRHLGNADSLLHSHLAYNTVY